MPSERAPGAAISMRISPSVRWSIKLLLSFALLWFILSNISFGSLSQALAHVDWAWIAGGVALLPVSVGLAALQIRTVIERQGLQMTVGELVALNLATSFYNLFLPGYLAGGAVRWYKLARAEGRPVEALAAVLYNRFVDSSLVLAAGAVFWLLDDRAAGTRAVPWLFGGLLAALVLAQRALAHRAVGDWIRRRLATGRLGAMLSPRFNGRIGTVLDAAARFDAVPARFIARVAGLCAARHLTGILTFYFFARALGLSLSFASAGWVRSVLVVVAMLPVSLGGLGVREGSLIAVLGPYGIAASTAVALGLLMFGRDLIAATAGGLLEARSFLSLQPSGD
ncbi:MAG TPA: lysylphosphatidylglycerol synthase transmembrane domain-containing protein [Gemmatimonadales bacterium]|nr:lysylphosphatidylglycerol synthase transmembrane domain-containing protein [Gemmatimonadales bacterium]